MTAALLAFGESLLPVNFAALSATTWNEVAGGAAVLITLVGVWLCWRAPRYRMSIEERAKDGLFTEDEARRKIRFIGWFAPAVTVAGCFLLAVAFMRWS